MCQPCHKVGCKQKMHTYVCLLGMLRSPFLCNCSVFQLMLWQLLLHCYKCNSLFLVQETSSSDDVCYRPQYWDLKNNDKKLSPNLQKTIWYTWQPKFWFYAFVHKRIASCSLCLSGQLFILPLNPDAKLHVISQLVFMHLANLANQKPNIYINWLHWEFKTVIIWWQFKVWEANIFW